MQHSVSTSALIAFGRKFLKQMVIGGIAYTLVSVTAGSVYAASLLEKIKSGQTIRLGFSSEMPWAYPGENNEPLGYVNAVAVDVLKKLGATKIEPVVTEWGSLIPGLQAGRFDIITGGMAIYPARCKNVLFTNPVDKDATALLVPKGNPNDLHSLADIKNKRLTFVTGTGWVDVSAAKQAGISDEKILQVSGLAEVVQAIKNGRADAASGGYYQMRSVAEKDQSLVVAQPYYPPQGVPGIPSYAGIAFALDQQDAVAAFNDVLNSYMGSDEMMSSVKRFGYTKDTLPEPAVTAATLCKG